MAPSSSRRGRAVPGRGSKRFASAALLVAASLGLAGCQGDDGIPPAPSGPATGAVPSSSITPTSFTVPAAPAPPGTQVVTDGQRGVAFALPQDFTAADFAVILADPQKKAEMNRLFTELGLAPGVLDQLAQQVSFAAFAQPTAKGSDTVSITRPSLPRFISSEEITGQLATFPEIRVGDTRSVPTSLGEARRTPYSYTLKTIPLSGEFLQVPSPAGITQVIVTSPTERTAAAIADTILATWSTR